MSIWSGHGSVRKRGAVLALFTFALSLAAPSVALAATPVVSGFSPKSGPIGTSVIVSGSGFTGATGVAFNGVAATFSNVGANSLTAVVPIGASSGTVSVTTPGGTGSSGAAFTVTIGIKLSKPAVPPTGSVAVSGSGFSPNVAVELYLNSTAQTPVVADSKGVFLNATLTVPVGTPPGKSWITAIDHRTGSSSQQSFLVRTDWPMFRDGPRRRGFQSTERILSRETVPDLELAWTSKVGNLGTYSSPVVAGGMVYIGAVDKSLYAFRTGCATGGDSCSPVWRGITTDAVSSTPAVAGNVVYVGSNDGMVYAFAINCATGGKSCQPLWKGNVGDQVYASPVVADGVVYVLPVTGRVHAFAVGCGTGGATCSPLWRGPVPPGAANPSYASPAVANGHVYVGTGDGKMSIYNVGCGSGGATCNATFSWTVTGAIQSSPAVADGQLYFGSSGGNLYAARLDCLGSCGFGLITYPTSSGIGFSSPAVAGSVVYIGDSGGALYAFPAHCEQGLCTEIWRAETVAQISSSPAVANGVVYVGSDNFLVYAFATNCSTGGGRCAPIWERLLVDRAYGSPAVADGVLYATSVNGLYAFDLAGQNIPSAPHRPDPRTLWSGH